MTYSLTFNKEIDLGKWSYNHSDEPGRLGVNAVASIKINETTEVNIYPINEKTGAISQDAHFPLSSTKAPQAYDSLLKTKEQMHVLCLILPARTHTIKDLLLDVSFPPSRRVMANVPIKSLPAVVGLIMVIAIDLITLVVRLLTVIPRAVYNHMHKHPVIEAGISSSSALYVKCKKTWAISANNETFPPGQVTCASTFYWQVDIHSPILNKPAFETIEFMSNHCPISVIGIPVYEEKGTERFSGRIFYQSLRFFRQQDLSLTDKLDLPDITYC